MGDNDKVRIGWEDIEEATREQAEQKGRGPSPNQCDSEPPIRVSWQDIENHSAEAAAEAEGSSTHTYGKIAAIRPPTGEVSAARRFFLSSPFYICVAGGAGALIGWGITEAIFDAGGVSVSYTDVLVHTALWFAVIGASVGAAVGAIEGALAGSGVQVLRGGGIGLGVGFVGCAFGGIVAQLLYTLLLSVSGDPSLGRVILARTLGWGVAGIFLGVAQGAAAFSGKKTLNGLLGGFGGGLLGGLLFDPIASATGGIRAGMVSRLVGLLAIGVAVGVLVGIVEQLLKDAWLHVIKGRLAGKQFVIYRNPTLVGSSPKCDIYLFKDDSVDPRHAAIRTVQNRYEIEDLGSQGGTFVNGRCVSRVPLRADDEIRIGSTVFRYSEKARQRQ